ncbi:major facilitator superfamily domain-containing protein [Penicillium cosmopolitanum]|uniref:Major facilitator superfamily domain-containing protein n=1 Tax=Penicillium cosmopolitanum TaxID=1131564 RepID=A0A9X0B2H2_9EURO|nr:major facilitator superfamily domain-containing protein [Penicillium cosmopolitanum]KAJ5385744.1 major facilitator superfamily domain-containing protein [Penicillium cosmopolitanum]
MEKLDKETLQCSSQDAESAALGTLVPVDQKAERSYVRKLDTFLLPFLSLMYFFNSVDRSNLGNSKTDGLEEDLNFVGNEYSLLILLFYIPFGTLDLPLNLLTKKFSAKWILPSLMVTWGSIATLQCAAKNFAGLLVMRLILGACEAGFYAGVVFYFTLFYKRSELGFRLAIFFGSALLAAAFSGLISYGVFRIQDPHIAGWQWLMMIEGILTVIVGVFSFWWLPASPASAWFLNDREKAAAVARALRDGSNNVDVAFSMKECFMIWKDWKFALWCLLCFTYPVAFATTSNFLPQIVQRLGYSVVKTNLWTVAPNAVGFLVLLVVAKSSDYCHERTFHVFAALATSLVGMLILITIDVLNHKAIAYFACFLMAAGSYIPSCLVQSWHNNNNLNENSRAATTGLLVGLGNFAGILSAATFRVEYAPKYIPTLITTCICNGIAMVCVLILGCWMKWENDRRNKAQGVKLCALDVDTSDLPDGEASPRFRYFT